jgi:hypothetical protein
LQISATAAFAKTSMMEASWAWKATVSYMSFMLNTYVKVICIWVFRQRHETTQFTPYIVYFTHISFVTLLPGSFFFRIRVGFSK